MTEVGGGGNSFGGYTCPSCLNWVPYGLAHHCPAFPSHPFPMPAPAPSTTVSFNYTLMLVLALNRLAAALEILCGKEPV